MRQKKKSPCLWIQCTAEMWLLAGRCPVHTAAGEEEKKNWTGGCDDPFKFRGLSFSLFLCRGLNPASEGGGAVGSGHSKSRASEFKPTDSDTD